MRDILPLHFNRLEGEVIFVDPKAEILQKKSNNIRSIHFGENRRPKVLSIGTLGKGMMKIGKVGQKGE